MPSTATISKYILTRTHSRRMRTVHCSGCQEGFCPGGCLSRGGVFPGGVCGGWVSANGGVCPGGLPGEVCIPPSTEADTLTDRRQVPGMCTPLGSKFFHFHAVFSKNFKNNCNFGSRHTPWGKSYICH